MQSVRDDDPLEAGESQLCEQREGCYQDRAREQIETGAASKDQIFIELKDSGTGMSAEQQARAFKSLLQTTKKRGTGIGLVIVSKIIEGHEGQISVQSSEGKGSTFRIVLPALKTT